MAYKFQVGSARMSGSLVQEGDLTLSGSMELQSGKSLVIGDASLTEAELEQIDGITAGTAAASKAVVLDASKDIAGINDMTLAGDVILPQSSNLYLAGDGGAAKIVSTGGNAVSIFGAKVVTNGSSIEPDSDGGTDLGSASKQFADLYLSSELKMGNAVITEAELEMLDGITAGTVAASKAVVVDANKDASGFRNVTGTGAITAGTSFIIGSADLNEADMEQIDGITAGTVAASKAVVVDSNKDISGLRNVTATGYFEIGSAQLTEAEMEQLDGITAGTVAASKAVVVDANKDIASFRHLTAAGAVTAGTSFIIGSADLNEADMEKLDGITNGAAAASKAVVLDASKDISGLNDVSAAGLTLSDLTSGRLPLVSTSGLLADDAQFTYATNRAQMNGYVALAVSSSASGSFYAMDGGLGIYDESDETILSVSKNGGFTLGDAMVEMNPLTGLVDIKGDLGLLHDGVYVGFGADEDVKLTHVADTGLLLNSSMQLQFGDSGTYIHQSADGVLDLVSDTEIEINATTIDVNGALDVSGNSVLGGTLTAASLGNATVDLTTDLMIINDGAGGVIKNTSLANYATALAAGSNEGLKSTAGRLGLDLNDLSAASVNVANDSIALIDADDSNATKKESIADLVSAMAGAGLTATSGVLSTQSGVVALIADSGTLVEGYNYLADLTADATVSLPASPSVGDVVHVKAAALANDSNVIINKQGSHVIDNDLTSIRIESAFGAVSLVYVVANEWRLV